MNKRVEHFIMIRIVANNYKGYSYDYYDMQNAIAKALDMYYTRAEDLDMEQVQWNYVED